MELYLRSEAAGRMTRLFGLVPLLRAEPERRARDIALAAEKRAEDQRRFGELQVIDWMRSSVSPTKPMPVPAVTPPPPPLAPARLILVDEADRLRVSSLGQPRDLFDRGEIGPVLIGIPGMEKRLARYPQLYSRVGFVHAFRSLRGKEIRHLLATQWTGLGIAVPSKGIDDPEAVAAVIRISGGNFRLIHRLLFQIERILRVNDLSTMTPAVVDTPREGLVIGIL
jgi:DNA transposition AAA+ family ATPase